jgi:GH24 family phage-related lysozyme (muramidase)
VRSITAAWDASGLSRRLRLRAAVSAGGAVAVAVALIAAVSPSAGAVSPAPARASACSRLAADPSGASCVGANSITEGEEHDIAYFEAPGGNPILHPYLDQLGYCTIGLGHLIRKGPCTKQDDKDWKDVTADDLIKLFHQDIAKMEAELNKLLIGDLRLVLNPCQYDGLFDLYFNGGPSWFQQKSGKLTQLTKALKAGNMAGAANILEKDVPKNLSAKDEKELSNRRKADAKEFRTRNCPCKIAPVSGSISGTVSFPASGYGFTSGNVTWSGTVDYSKQVENVPTFAEYDATSGTIGWAFTPTGTLPSGCRWTVTSGTLSDPGPPYLLPADFIALNATGGYYAQLGAFTRGFSDGIASSQYTCVNGTGPPTNILVDMDIDFMTPTPGVPYKNGKLTGSYTIDNGADGTATWKWDLSFSTLPPVTP